MLDKIFIRGRHKIDEGKISLFNGGSMITLKVKATKLTFFLESNYKPCYVYVIRDFDYKNKEKILVENNLEITINFPHSTEEHIVDLIKANEAIDNNLIVKKIEVEGTILPYKLENNKFIKVYGDSSIAGYGILAYEGEASIHTNDAVENFCFKALYSLNYDFDIFSASGWGLSFSMYTNPKNVGIERFKDNLCVNSNEKYEGKVPDLLIISLGTNDKSYIDENSENKEELEQKFASSYLKLIKDERKKKTNLPVIMIYGSLKEENVYSLIEKTYKIISSNMNNVYLLKLPGDNSAISNHSFLTYHEFMAETFKKKILSILS